MFTGSMHLFNSVFLLFFNLFASNMRIQLRICYTHFLFICLSIKKRRRRRLAKYHLRRLQRFKKFIDLCYG